MSGQTVVSIPGKSHAEGKSIPFDLRSPDWFARWPIIGAALFIFGGVIFGALTYNLFAQGPLLKWDQSLATTLPAMGLTSPSFVKYLMNAGFYLGKDALSVLVFFHAIYFFIKRYWQELWLLLAGVIGGSLLFYVLSHIIGRDRPANQIWIIVSSIPSFPSGHAVTAVAFFGLIVYLMLPRISSKFWKAFVVVVAILIILFIGFSRIFTGGHYLTDVLAGYALGFAWCGLVYTLIEIYFKNRRSRNGKKG